MGLRSDSLRPLNSEVCPAPSSPSLVVLGRVRSISIEPLRQATFRLLLLTHALLSRGAPVKGLRYQFELASRQAPAPTKLPHLFAEAKVWPQVPMAFLRQPETSPAYTAVGTHMQLSQTVEITHGEWSIIELESCPCAELVTGFHWSNVCPEGKWRLLHPCLLALHTLPEDFSCE